MNNFKLITMVGVALLFLGCSKITPETVKKEPKDIPIFNPCSATQLAPFLMCGNSVIVKGRINQSNNLERLNDEVMYLGGIENTEPDQLSDKSVLLSGQCSYDSIVGTLNIDGSSGGSGTMIYLNEAKLLQLLDNKKVNMELAKKQCSQLKKASH